jgi:hypothetical protein
MKDRRNRDGPVNRRLSLYQRRGLRLKKKGNPLLILYGLDDENCHAAECVFFAR